MKHLSIALAVWLALQGCSVNDGAPQSSAATPASAISPAAPASGMTEMTPPVRPAKKDRPPRTLPLPLSELATSLGITAEHYPLIDGSTATLPLVQQIYIHMFKPSEKLPVYIEPAIGVDRPFGAGGYIGLPKQAAQTVAACKKLIAGDLDLILVPDPSEDVKQQARDAGVELEYVFIGAEALVFITSGKNPVQAVTREQLLGIYSSMTIRNWSDLGGGDGLIVALIRNKDSGSHGQMENLVLRGKPIHRLIEEEYEGRERSRMGSMRMMLDRVGLEDYQNHDEQHYAIGYTVYYYLQRVLAWERWSRGGGVVKGGMEPEELDRWLDIKTLAVDGVLPTPETILSKEYPLAMGYYAVIRKDEPADSPARKIAAWLLTDQGQQAVTTAGLGALKPTKFAEFD